MSGYWLPIVSSLMSIGIIGAVIALKYDRITPETHRYLSIVCATALVVLGISSTWTSLDSRQTFERIESKREALRVRTAGLKSRVDANKATLQQQRAALQETTRRLLAGEGQEASTAMSEQDYLSALQKDASALAAEAQALSTEIAAVHTELEALKRGRETTEFWQAIVVVALMLPIVSLSVHRNAVRKRSVTERSAALRPQSIDPMLPSNVVKELARSGRKIQAIRVYRGETGARLAEAKRAVEAYLDEAAQSTSTS
jgi:ribosomal protein L7/L12